VFSIFLDNSEAELSLRKEKYRIEVVEHKIFDKMMHRTSAQLSSFGLKRVVDDGISIFSSFILLWFFVLGYLYACDYAKSEAGFRNTYLLVC